MPAEPLRGNYLKSVVVDTCWRPCLGCERKSSRELILGIKCLILATFMRILLRVLMFGKCGFKRLMRPCQECDIAF